jgi:nicotinamidase/pyrazinamidase
MNALEKSKVKQGASDALIVVDIQNDFLPGGNLAVPQGDEIIPAFHLYLEAAKSKNLPVFASRDWHPQKHCSFKAQGGLWPSHCVADSEGARFPPGLSLPFSAVIISKGTEIDHDAYSGFEGTDLDEKLRSANITRLFIGGLATDYCVLNTVRDALKLGYKVFLLKDAIRAVNVQPEDGRKAEEEMTRLGAIPITWEMIE